MSYTAKYASAFYGVSQSQEEKDEDLVASLFFSASCDPIDKTILCILPPALP